MAQIVVKDAGKSSSQKVLINGQDIINFTRSVKIGVGVDHIPEVTIDLICLDGAELEVESLTTLGLTLLPNFEFVKEELGEGKMKYTCRRIKPV